MVRLIDADAFIAFIKDTTRNHGYNTLELNEYLTVSDVADAIISDLDGTSLDGFKNAPTVDAVPVSFLLTLQETAVNDEASEIINEIIARWERERKEE